MANHRPPLNVGQILAWADEHRRRAGRWPTQRGGGIAGGGGLTWSAVNAALREGRRGLPGGDSLARLLARERAAGRPPLSEQDIVCWARRHRERVGRWPAADAGPVADAPGEVWGSINQALLWGRRGLVGGSSLSRLLAPHRDPGRGLRRPRLILAEVLRWAEAHRRRTGRWPTAGSGTISEAPAETWRAVNNALVQGNRGLPGGDSLSRLLRRQACGAELLETLYG
jgi:hypothetical protein